jgi:hypothetical protein
MAVLLREIPSLALVPLGMTMLVVIRGDGAYFRDGRRCDAYGLP